MCVRRFVLLTALCLGYGISRPAQAGEPLDRAITLANQGWGEMGVDVAAHAAGKQGRRLQFGERYFDKGIGTHAPSRLAVDLWGEYARFEAEIGVQAHPEHSRGSVVFQVIIDGEKRFDSGVMRQTDPSKAIRVPLEGAQEMELVVTDAGDGIECDLANWANAVLVRAAGTTARADRVRLNMAPFARVVTWDPRQRGSHPGRVEELEVNQIFLEEALTPGGGGVYTAPVSTTGEACVGLQWYENRHITELGLQFAEKTPTPAPDGVRVEWWVGESAWQGDWRPLEGTWAHDDAAWRFRVARDEVWQAKTGVQKVRWVFPASAAPVRVRAFEAYTRSRCGTAELRLECHGAAAGSQGEVAVYNGEILDDAVGRRAWDLAARFRVKVRYCTSKPGFARSDRTVLRIRAAGGAFGVAVEDVLENGCVYVPDFGVFVTLEPDGIDFDAYRQRVAGNRTILDQVRAMPDQSFGQAMAHVHREIQNNGPTMLSLACDNHKFTVHDNGRVQHRFDPEVDLDQDRRKAVASPVRLLEVVPTFGSGASEAPERHLEGAWLPIVVATLREGGVACRMRAFVAPYDKTGPPEPPGWLNPKPLFIEEFALDNRLSREAEVSLSLAFRPGGDEQRRTQLQASPRGVVVQEAGKLLAVVDTTAAPGLETAIQDGALTMRGRLPARSTARCLLYVPGWEMAGEDHESLAGGTDLTRDVEAYWRSVMADAIEVAVPEPLLENLIYASQVHCLMTARNEAHAARVAPWCGADRYGPLESESQAIIHGMGLMGHDAFARRSLDFFIRRYNADGLLTTGYTLMGMGWHLWTLADYYAVHQNAAWLEQVAPRLERACQWIVREREKTKRLNPDGTKPLEYGLVSPGVAADWSRFAYRARSQGEFYAGLVGVARAYSAIGYPGGEDLVANAEEFRAEIRRAYEWTQARSPVVRLRNGAWIPYCPAIMGCFGRVMDLYPNEDGGRSWGKDMSMGAHNLVVLGVLDDHRSVGWIANYLEDFWCLQSGMGAYPHEGNIADWFNLGGFSKVQPYYTRLVEVYARMDDVKPFIRAYFNAIPSLLNTENLALWEHFNNAGAWNKPHETGWFLTQTRLMLVMERGDDLWLAPFVTQHWMNDGQAVRVRNAPTRFGPVGYAITSHVAEEYIEAWVDPPTRRRPGALVLRLRHPEGKPMKAVTVDGQPHRDFDAVRECVRIEPTAKRVAVRAHY